MTNLLTSPYNELSIRVCSSRAEALERLSSPGLESAVDGMDQIAACISAFKLWTAIHKLTARQIYCTEKITHLFHSSCLYTVSKLTDMCWTECRWIHGKGLWFVLWYFTVHCPAWLTNKTECKLAMLQSAIYHLTYDKISAQTVTENCCEVE